MMGYEFTTDWFSDNAADWKRIVDAIKPVRYLEVGSYEGRSVCALMENAPTLRHVTCIDSWSTDTALPEEDFAAVEKRFDKNVIIANNLRLGRGHHTVDRRKIKAKSRDGLRPLHLENKPFDLIYIDGSHLPEHCLEDMVLAFPLLRKQGVMIVDDYLWNPGPGHPTPKAAIDAFTTIFDRHCKIIGRQSLYQMYLLKTSEW